MKKTYESPKLTRITKVDAILKEWGSKSVGSQDIRKATGCGKGHFSDKSLSGMTERRDRIASSAQKLLQEENGSDEEYKAIGSMVVAMYRLDKEISDKRQLIVGPKEQLGRSITKDHIYDEPVQQDEINKLVEDVDQALQSLNSIQKRVITIQYTTIGKQSEKAHRVGMSIANYFSVLRRARLRVAAELRLN